MVGLSAAVNTSIMGQEFRQSVEGVQSLQWREHRLERLRPSKMRLSASRCNRFSETSRIWEVARDAFAKHGRRAEGEHQDPAAVGTGGVELHRMGAHRRACRKWVFNTLGTSLFRDLVMAKLSQSCGML